MFPTQTGATSNDNHDNDDDPDDSVGSHDKEDHRAIFTATFIYRSIKHPFQRSVWAHIH